MAAPTGLHSLFYLCGRQYVSSYGQIQKEDTPNYDKGRSLLQRAR